MAKRTLTDRVQKVFDYTIQANTSKRRLEVYYLRDSRGRAWVPYGGGPLYDQHAIDQSRWVAEHVEKYRDLLPRDCRNWPIVCGELSTATYPGVFYPVAAVA